MEKNMLLTTDTRISTDFSRMKGSPSEKSVEIRVSVAFSCLFSNWSGCLGKDADKHLTKRFFLRAPQAHEGWNP
jgi:hypothetical protein